MSRRFYLTTPIYYVNDVPHIGHTYTTVVGDVLARYHRMIGDSVWYLTGTDEHGQKVERAASRQSVAPQELCDRNSRRFRELWDVLGISHDDFIRTTEPRHRAGVERIYRTIRDKGDIYLGEYAGFYCTGCEATFPESQITGGVCPDQGHAVDRIQEPSYFFRLSKYQQPLLEHYRRNPGFVRPETRRNEVVAFVESGLKDLSVSRTSFRWGIPVPDDPGHVIYVWFDALSNYITAIGYGSDDERFASQWPAQIHLVGKDILRFHAVYWPAFLLSAGLPLPECVFGHGWWLMDDAKMSKSRGNVARPGPLVEAFGVDALRYFLMREMTFGADANYSDEALIDRLNADLANDLGNLTHRLLTMIESYRGGRLPAPRVPSDAGEAIQATAERALAGYREHFEACQFDRGLASLWEIVTALNRAVDREAPWKLAKGGEGDQERLDALLYHATQALASVACGLSPVMPAKAAELWAALGGDGDPAGRWEGGAARERIPVGSRVRRGEPLFPRIDKKSYFAKEEKNVPPTGPEKEKPAEKDDRIDIQQFMSVDLRVAEVKVAERVEGTDKLLRLEVDLGGETRQIVAGVAAKYPPEQLIGKRIIVVANLKPARLRGVESQGMLLAADLGGTPIVATFEEPVAPGTRVR